MKWFPTLALVVLSFFAMPTWACTITGTTLTPEALTKMELECLKAERLANEAAAAATTATNVEQLSAYADIATQVAKAIGVAARELGVEVNNFVMTPAGMLTVAVILMKVFGKLFALIFVAIFVNYVTWGVLRRIWFVETDQTIEVSHLFFFKKTIQVHKQVSYKEATDGQVFISFILLVVSIVPLVFIPIFS